jgi:diguanylate cyclase (GGDEF)-like protein
VEEFLSKIGPDQLQSPELLKQILDSLPVGVWIMDRDGRIVHGNPAGQKIWAGARYVGAEQFGEYKGWRRDSGQRIEAAEWAGARAISKGETSLNEEIEIECFDGTHKIILNSALPIRDDAGAVIGGIIVNVDITERVALEDRLRIAADTDDLTRAYSRRRFYELLHEEVGRANRYRRALSLAMFDVDRFKQINDEHGHLIGDQVLVSLCNVVRDQIRESEYLARFGGDEFMLLLPEARLDDAVRIVERLRESLAGHSVGAVGPVACSFGVCEYVPGESADNLIRRADRALYEAKASGRNRLAVGPATGQ